MSESSDKIFKRMERPLVSIITVTYNAKDFLEETFRSVWSQTYPHIEYIVVDGASTDGTRELIEANRDKIARWVSEPDKGLYDAMNKGIRMAKGELIGIVNASDYFEPDTVETVVQAFMEHPGIGIFHGNVNMLNDDGSFFKLKKPRSNDLSAGMCYYHPTCFVARSVYGQLGGYDLAFRYSADYDFLLRCQVADIPFLYIDKVLSNFRRGGVSTTSKQTGMQEARDILVKNGFPTDYADKMLRLWEHKNRKDLRLQKAYNIMKKILPASWLNQLASVVRG